MNTSEHAGLFLFSRLNMTQKTEAYDRTYFYLYYKISRGTSTRWIGSNEETQSLYIDQDSNFHEGCTA